jgi:CheY-like chemotaxis protein
MHRATIVVVNDDAAYIEMVSELLGDEGYRTFPCTGSRFAYQIIKRERADLVLLDIHMESPDSGMNVLALLRLDRDTRDIPVLVCSADARFLNEKAERLRAYGCELLEKPFDVDDLIGRIEGMLRAPQLDRVG